MSIELRRNKSLYDMLFEQFTELFQMFVNIFKFIIAIGSVVFISYISYQIYERRCKRFTNELTCNLRELQKIKEYQRSFVRQRNIIGHKEMLKALEQAADECYKVPCALKCIDIVVHCPQLLNVKSPLNGMTPFHRICLQGNKSLITFMLAKGADPTITTATGENALSMAIYYFLNNPTDNDLSCLERLVGNGCSFNTQDKCYNRLLEMAFSINHGKMIQWLILHQNGLANEISRCSSMPLIRGDTRGLIHRET